MRIQTSVNTIRKRIRVTGVVQGVGFRPFVWRLATELGCTGSVCNDSNGVLIEIQGLPDCIETFQRRLLIDAPPSARIAQVLATICDPILEPTQSEGGFQIDSSRQAEKFAVGVAPDVSVCQECLAELNDPSNRRFGYPFINCTNCGPRFTIIESLPYDRQRTTMKAFRMCEACQLEYESPDNRRFHAEPNACAMCGPQIWFLDTQEDYSECYGTERDVAVPVQFEAERVRTWNALGRAQSMVAQGMIVAVKGIGGFHLACDATNHESVRKLRLRKQRPDKPLAVMVADLETCSQFAKVSSQEMSLLQGQERPIVLLEKKFNHDWLESVAPGNPMIGVMLAYSPLHYLLIPPGQIWVMTSGNLSDEPIAIDNLEAWQRLRSLADGFLMHNRTICVECDDSVLRQVDTGVAPVRRSRGFAPLAIDLGADRDDTRIQPTVLAVGGELKATVCLAIGSQAYLSQHIGDMGNEESQRTMQRVSHHLIDLYQTQVELIAADLHPGYLSVVWAEQLARKLSVPLIKIQHHHAHAVSLMAEHGLPANSQIIACVFDGTGYGTDQTIWGGEWLIASSTAFRRYGHLRRVPLPGGDACVLRPARSALAHLFAESIDWSEPSPCLQTLTEVERKLLRKQLENGVHCTETTSMGRLFDAVAALSGVRQQIYYEGQAAIELESLSVSEFRSRKQIVPYPFRWFQADAWELHVGEMLNNIVAEHRCGSSAGEIGARFHQTLAIATVEICLRAREETGIGIVGLTGGVFQNALLTQLVRSALSTNGFRVLTHHRVPPNDAGLALGQVAIARSQAGLAL